MERNKEILPHSHHSVIPIGWLSAFEIIAECLQGKQFINFDEIKTDIGLFFASKPEEYTSE